MELLEIHSPLVLSSKSFRQEIQRDLGSRHYSHPERQFLETGVIGWNSVRRSKMMISLGIWRMVGL